MENQIILDKNIFNPDSSKFLSSDEFSTLLFIFSEERVFNPIIELSSQKLVEKGLLSTPTNANYKRLRATINKLNNKDMLNLIGEEDGYYSFSVPSLLSLSTFKLSPKEYLNALVQVENTTQMHILQYVVLSVGSKQSFQSFTYKQLSTNTGVPLLDCKETVKWLVENGLLLLQSTEPQSTSKVYKLSQFNKKERING